MPVCWCLRYAKQLTKTLVNLLSSSFGSGMGCLARILACRTWCCVLIVSGEVVIGDSLRVELALPIVISHVKHHSKNNNNSYVNHNNITFIFRISMQLEHFSKHSNRFYHDKHNNEHYNNTRTNELFYWKVLHATTTSVTQTTRVTCTHVRISCAL